MAQKLKVHPASTMTWVLFPMPTSRGSQPPLTPAPGDLKCSLLTSMETCTDVVHKYML